MSRISSPSGSSYLCAIFYSSSGMIIKGDSLKIGFGCTELKSIDFNFFFFLGSNYWSREIVPIVIRISSFSINVKKLGLVKTTLLPIIFPYIPFNSVSFPSVVIVWRFWGYKLLMRAMPIAEGLC